MDLTININNLKEGLKLDFLVAKEVMKWQIHWRDPTFRGGQVHWRDSKNSTCHLPGQWCPSSNIDAAEQVMDTFEHVFLYKFADGRWECKLSEKDLPEYYMIAETKCVAICRAALIATFFNLQA